MEKGLRGYLEGILLSRKPDPVYLCLSDVVENVPSNNSNSWEIEPLMPPIVAAELPKGLPDLQRCREMRKPFGLIPEENFGTPFQTQTR